METDTKIEEKQAAPEPQGESGTSILIKVALILIVPTVVFYLISHLVG